MSLLALLTAFATILDRLARLWPAFANELQAARDRANAAHDASAQARYTGDAALIDADVAAAKAKIASERADNPPAPKPPVAI